MTTPAYEPITGPTLIEGRNLAIVIDGYLSERHEASASVTDHPVESGARVADHAVRNPYRLEVVGYVSDVMPPTPSAAAAMLNRTARAWAEILAAMENSDLLTATTILGTYRSLVVESAEAPQDQSTGRGLLATLRLKELQTAKAVVSLPSPVPVSGPAVDRAEPAIEQRVATGYWSLSSFDPGAVEEAIRDALQKRRILEQQFLVPPELDPGANALSVITARFHEEYGEADRGGDAPTGILATIFGWIPGVN